ncbi:MAG: type II toxin-antitoxin system HicA family toxin [Proteiniphilum sp.]
MKYHELEKKLQKAGCYPVGSMKGHPLWYSPITGKYFKMSHHGKQEIAVGTLKGIIRDSGIKF